MTLLNTDQTAFNDTRPTESVKSIGFTTSDSSTIAAQTRFTEVDTRSTDWNSIPAIANLKHPEYKGGRIEENVVRNRNHPKRSKRPNSCQGWILLCW